VLVAAAIWARRRRSEFAAAPYTPLQFEDLPPPEIFALDLHCDSHLTGGEQYIDTWPTSPPADSPSRIVPTRARRY
jgi:hypothetical protein